MAIFKIIDFSYKYNIAVSTSTKSIQLKLYTEVPHTTKVFNLFKNDTDSFEISTWITFRRIPSCNIPTVTIILPFINFGCENNILLFLQK